MSAADRLAEERDELLRIAYVAVIRNAEDGGPVDSEVLAKARAFVQATSPLARPLGTGEPEADADPDLEARPRARRPRNGARYDSLYQRLLANTEEPENDAGCWRWTGKLGGGHYARFNLWVPGLHHRVTLQAHIALWVWLQAEPKSIDEFYLQYRTLTDSGLELDHLCVTAECVCPDHVDPCTPVENIRRRDDRPRLRAQFTPLAEAA